MKADRMAIAALMLALGLGPVGCEGGGAGRAGPAPRREGAPAESGPGSPVGPSPDGARTPSRDAGPKPDE